MEYVRVQVDFWCSYLVDGNTEQCVLWPVDGTMRRSLKRRYLATAKCPQCWNTECVVTSSSGTSMPPIVLWIELTYLFSFCSLSLSLSRLFRKFSSTFHQANIFHVSRLCAKLWWNYFERHARHYFEGETIDPVLLRGFLDLSFVHRQLAFQFFSFDFNVGTRDSFLSKRKVRSIRYVSIFILNFIRRSWKTWRLTNFLFYLRGKLKRAIEDLRVRKIRNIQIAIWDFSTLVAFTKMWIYSIVRFQLTSSIRNIVL